MLEIKSAVVVVVVIFLKDNGLCGRLVDSNYFYKEESKCVHKFLCMCNTVCMHIARTVITLHTICEGL